MSATVADQGECMEHFISGLHRVPEWSIRLGDLCAGGEVVLINRRTGVAKAQRRDGSTFELRRDA